VIGAMKRFLSLLPGLALIAALIAMWLVGHQSQSLNAQPTCRISGPGDGAAASGNPAWNTGELP
jgi:hypothetical protein